MNKFEIKSPIFRHSDFKIIGNKINICQSKDYYFNNSKYLKKSISEFKTRKYSLINHDNKNFYSRKKKKFISRSDILLNIIKKKIKNKNCKILDFGCNKGFLLAKLSKISFKNLYGYDLGKHYVNFLFKKNINFISNLSQKKNFFDVIIFSHSVAYLENIEKFLILVKKITKQKSTLFFNIQDIEKRPLNFFLGDQKYYFNKNMVKNFFGKYGKVKFFNEELLLHELLFFFQFTKKKTNKKFCTTSNEVLKAKELIKKIRKINCKCDILGTNLNSALTISILKKKVENVVVEYRKSSNFFFKKKIICISEHKKKSIPLLINFGNENNLIISRLKEKFKLKNFIKIQ